MTASWTILAAGLIAVIAVTAHELTEHDAGPVPPPPDRPGNDDQWRDMADELDRHRHQRERARGRGRAD